MINHFNQNIHYTSFLEIYQEKIAPQLESLDILFKSMDTPLTIAEASQALYISEQEIKHIMREYGIREIDRGALLCIMENGSSFICRLYQRELHVGSPYVYSREDVSYIYTLPIDAVNHACDELGAKELTAYTLPDLFGHVFDYAPCWVQDHIVHEP
ncbi:MAG: hypothetical protein LBT44_02755 [Clostridiales bacterium]|jgi:hypothetical protein|nr:hypothetical protein [Clostridiales bacterium]